MREIKFRAWDTDHKKMKSWDRILFKDDSYNFCDLDQPEHATRLIWMQYTGLNDKNGKEIYEGDIIRYKWHTGGSAIGTIIFNSKKSRFNWQDEIDEFLYGMFDSDKDYREIIGNIYENPELLEES